MPRIERIFICLIAVSFFAVLIWSTPAGAASLADMGGWKWKAEAEGEFAYNTNVYHLSSSQANRLDANTAADQTSGRFNDMESVGDFVLTPALTLTGKRTGYNGRDLTIKPEISYELYASNTKKSHFELGVKFVQDVTDVDAVGVAVDYAPGVFSKNYLSDAVDGNANLLIEDSERVYSAGTHDDISAELFWKRRLDYIRAANVKTIDGELMVGYAAKSFDAPFDHRSEDSYLFGAGVDLELESKVDLSFSYLFEHVSVPVASEVLIRDEPDFGVDINLDGDALDNNVRIVSTVDRSRNEHTFGVRAGKKLEGDWYGRVRYDLRFQNYDSKETYDITRQDRSDVRHRIGLGADRVVAKNLTLGIDWLWAHEKAGRDALAAVDPTESKSYDAHTFSAVLSYSL